MNDKKEISNFQVTKLLRDAYNTKIKATKRSIKFPSKLRVYSVDCDNLEIVAGKQSIFANMQTDEGAIDTWATVLSIWLQKNVIISWIVPEIKPTGNELLHYNRFIYRLENLSQRITDGALGEAKIQISKEMAPEISRYSLYKGQNLVVNTGDWACRDSASISDLLLTENDIEIFFYNHPELLTRLQSFTSKFRQFSVGLFLDEVKEGKEVFPARKSAIDLMLTNESEILVVELKKPDNKSIGILSELAFYCYFINDATDGRFQSSVIPKNRLVLVKGCILISKDHLHPLIDDRVLSFFGEDVLKTGCQVPVYFYTISNDGSTCSFA